jgi:hypothetical protein
LNLDAASPLFPVVLVVAQGAVVGAWCFLCLVTATISVVLITGWSSSKTGTSAHPTRSGSCDRDVTVRGSRPFH